MNSFVEKTAAAEDLLSPRRIQELDHASRALDLSEESGEPNPFEIPELEEWMATLRRDEKDNDID